MISEIIKKVAIEIKIDPEKHELGVWKLRLTEWTDWYKSTLDRFEKAVNDALSAAQEEQEGKINLVEVQEKQKHLKNVVDLKVEEFLKFQEAVNDFLSKYADAIIEYRKKENTEEKK